MKQYKAVLFDMDGLMFDTEVLAKQGLYDAAEELGLVPDMDLFIGITGCNKKESNSRLIKYCGSEEKCRELRRIQEQKLVDTVSKCGTPLKPGLVELVRHLEKEHIKRAVVSCSLKIRVYPCIEHSGLGSSFDPVITGEEVKNGKPAPDAYLIASSRLVVSPDECLVLEDSVNGGMAGLAAGMDVALIPDLIKPTEEEKARFQYVFNTLYEVIPLFE